jgi:5-methyltetrahydrofolate--homocysteine methyltransferase
MTFKELLKTQKFIYLDGAMGTMLQKKKINIPHVPEILNITNPDVIREVHAGYVMAGSDIIYTNTFGANRYKLKDSGYSVEEIVRAGVQIAREAAVETNALCALDVGLIGTMLEPTGTLSFEEAYDIYKEIVLAGSEADCIVFETQTDLYEIKAAVLAAKENTDKPVMCTMTFEENKRTFTGCNISSMALTLEGLGVDAIGVNCSLGPRELYPIIEELSKWTDLPIIFKPNAGLPDPLTNLFNIDAEEFAYDLSEAVQYGVRIFGGCCGTTPLHIKRMIDYVEKCEPAYNKEKERKTAICSYSNTVVVNQPRVIGERINPTGKKMFKEALRKNDIDYILNQAIEQINAGADILDVNVGLPEIDEREMMIRTIKALQSVVDVPLQIDSTIPAVLESALRVYNGKPIVNSVNGEEESMNKILPLVKKYGACVICLTLDENGIPKKAKDRVAIAERIMNRALEIGIKKENLIVDCLTLTASAEQAAVMETLKALTEVKQRLGLRTCLGVSNISFGLPNREMITHNFLTMALYAGLDLPIINPNIESIMGSVRSYKLLANIDKNAAEFVSVYANNQETKKPENKANSGEKKTDIIYAIKNGLKAEGVKATEEMLENTDPMVIVNENIIPALDEVGDKFEKGIIFLPQLILSAGVVQAAFETIKKKMVENNSAPISKGKVVLATVKGDIHDIGKNIVKVLLENYGYDVIDLGKDVPYEAVVEAVKKDKVQLAGLSALMTTTLVSMEETIKLLRKECPWCKVVVGGAVLTPEYAEKIDADFYAKDAKETVDIAKRVVTV